MKSGRWLRIRVEVKSEEPDFYWTYLAHCNNPAVPNGRAPKYGHGTTSGTPLGELGSAMRSRKLEPALLAKSSPIRRE
jgi:hypothetical protein